MTNQYQKLYQNSDLYYGNKYKDTGESPKERYWNYIDKML